MNAATIDFDISAAEAKIAELGKQLEELQKAAKAKGGEAAKSAAADVKKQVEEANEALKQLQKTQSDLEKSQEKARDLFAKGVGGGETAEKLKSIREGLAIYKNEANDASTRNQALVGSLGLMGRVAMGVAGEVMQFASSMIEANARLDEHQRHLDALGPSYQATRAATDGAMNAADQFAIRQATLAQNVFLTSQQMATMNAAMRQSAIETGGTATEAASRFEHAVLAADNNALAPFGVRLDASVPIAQRMSQAINQLSENHRTQATITRTATEVQRMHEEGTGRLRDTVLGILDPFHELDERVARTSREQTAAARAADEHRQALLAQKHQLEQLQTAIDNVNHVMRDQQNIAMTGLSNALASVTNQVIRYTQELDRASNAGQRLAFNADLEQQGLNQTESRMAGLRQVIQNRRAERANNRALVAEGRREGYSDADLIGAGVLQQGQHHDTKSQIYNAAEIAAAASDEEIARHRNETLQQMESDTRKAYEDMSETAQAEARKQARALDDAYNGRHGYTNGTGAGGDYGVDPEQLRQMQEAQDFSTQFANVFAQNTEHAASMAQSFSATVASSMGTATGALRSHFAAWVAGRETVGEAAQAIVHEVLLSLATEAAIKAIFNYGEAIAAAATYRYAEAAQHLAAAGIYTAVAGIAGAGAAITVPHPSAAATGSNAGGLPPAAAQAHTSSGQGSSGGNVFQITFSGATYGTREELHDSLVHGINEAVGRGAVLRTGS